MVVVVVVDTEEVGESVARPDVAGFTARRVGDGGGGGGGVRFSAAEGGGGGGGGWDGDLVAGGGVDGSEALTEARGAEAGDGLGGVAVTPGNAYTSRLGMGMGMGCHHCTKRVVVVVVANRCMLTLSHYIISKVYID